MQVFNCRVIDQNLALGYCTILHNEDMFNKLWDVINNTWQNYRKVLVNSQGNVFLQQIENVKQFLKKKKRHQQCNMDVQ